MQRNKKPGREKRKQKENRKNVNLQEKSIRPIREQAPEKDTKLIKKESDKKADHYGHNVHTAEKEGGNK